MKKVLPTLLLTTLVSLLMIPHANAQSCTISQSSSNTNFPMSGLAGQTFTACETAQLVSITFFYSNSNTNSLPDGMNFSVSDGGFFLDNNNLGFNELASVTLNSSELQSSFSAGATPVTVDLTSFNIMLTDGETYGFVLENTGNNATFLNLGNDVYADGAFTRYNTNSGQLEGTLNDLRFEVSISNCASPITSLSEDFEAIPNATQGVPACWSSDANGLTTSGALGKDGSQGLIYSVPNTPDTAYIVLPEIDNIESKKISFELTSGVNGSGSSEAKVVLYQSSSADPIDNTTNTPLDSINLTASSAFRTLSFDMPVNPNSSSQGDYLRLGIMTSSNTTNTYVAIDNVVLTESSFLSNLNEDFATISDDSPLPAGWIGVSAAPWTSTKTVGVFAETLQTYTNENNDAIVVLPGIENLSNKVLTFTAEVEFPVNSSQLEVFVKSSQTSSVEGLTPIANYTFGSDTPETFNVNMPALGVTTQDGNYIVFKINNLRDEVDGNMTGFVRTRLDNFSSVDAVDFGLVSRYSFTNNSRSDDVGSSGTLFLVTNDFGAPPASAADRFGASSNAISTGFEQYVRVSNPVIDVTQDFTINEWFNISAFGNEDGGALFDSRFRADRSEGGGLTLLAMKTGGLNLATYTSTGGFQNTLSLPNMGKVRLNEWHMATVTKKSDTIYVYLDGQLVGSGVPSDIENGTIWSLGGQNNNRPLRGTLDDVSFYNQALDPALIDDLFLSAGFNKNRSPVDITLNASPISEDAPIGTVIGTFSTTDADEGDTHTYEIIGDANIPSITVNGDNLIVEGQLDAEGLNPFRFNVTTTDQAGLSFQKLVEFEIIDENEAPTDIAFNSASAIGTQITKSENNANLNIGTFIAIDEDNNDSHTFSISGEDSDSFVLTDNLLASVASFDYESDSIYLFTITTEDAGGESFSKDYTLKVTDNNDAPSDILILNAAAVDTIFVDEMNAANDSIATLITIDQDTADTHQYEFVNNFQSDPIFTLDGDILRADIVFDYEDTPSYEVGIRTLDPDFEQTTKNFVVIVNDVNEAPTDLFFVGASPDFRANISENNAIGDSIAKIGVTDPDLDETFTFELSGEGAEDFIIVGDLITAARIFDHETEDKTTYSLTITVTDKDGLTYAETVNIFILDVLEFGPNQEVAVFDFTSGNLIDEINGFEAEAASFNQNTGEQLFPELTSDRFDEQDKALQMSQNRSLVVSNQMLESFEQSFSINLWFRLDAETPSGSAQFVLQHPGLFAAIGDNQRLLVQGSSNSGTAFVVSPEDILQPETWYMLTIVGDRSNAPNQVDVYLNNQEPTTGALPELFDASLGGWYFGSTSGSQLHLLGKMDDITFFQKALETGDVDELWANFDLVGSAPTDITLSNTTIAEDLPTGTTIGTLSTTDADENDTHNYTLSGADANSFTVEGDELRSAIVFDFETKSEYNIEVTTDDGNGGTFTKPFTILIEDTDENNAPTDIILTSENVAENQDLNTLVGLLTTNDADEADTHSYTLGGIDQASFAIGVPSGSETQQLGLLAAESFDFEAKASYSIDITTDDGKGGTFIKSFNITVSDQNEAPTDISLTNASIVENLDSGSSIGYFTTSDQDQGDSHTITLEGDDASSFSLAIEFVEGPGNVYVLRSAEVFDFETKNQYVIGITSTDQSGLSISENFVIEVLDEELESNDPTDIILSNQSVIENQPVGTLVGTISTVDPDEGDTHTYTLGGDQRSFFTLDGSNLLTAEIFDANERTNFEIEVTADDGNGGSLTKSFIITVLEETVLNLEEESDLVIYPNPATKTLFIKSPFKTPIQTDIIDLNGKILESKSISNELDVSELPSGVYLLRYTLDGKTKIKRFLKK